MISFLASAFEVLVATFISLVAGLVLALQTGGGSRRPLAFALGVALWLFIDTSNDALTLDVNSGFAGGWEQLGLVGLFAVGLLSLLGIEYLRSRGRAEDSVSRDSAYLFAALVTLGIGFHSIGEGVAFGSLAASTPSGSVIDAMGGYGPGIGYVLHKFLEGFVIGAILRAYMANTSVDRMAWPVRVAVLGALGSIMTLFGDALGYYVPPNAIFLFALGAGSTIYMVARLARPLFSAGDAPGRDGTGDLALFVLFGLLTVYFAGLFHSVSGL